jgi:DNA (cytosine-5)-methyltransferase 1
MKAISLFSGVGGFDLGFERAGIRTVLQAERDPHCLKVLERHWPDVRRIDDVRLVATHQPFDMCPPECIGVQEIIDEWEGIDVIHGGFPCQDISNAGTTHAGGLTGLAGERSGLWREFYRIVCLVEPRWVVIENVGALTVRGLDTVLGDLAASGFDAEWAVLSAAALGAPHLRKRLFIVAWRPDLLSDSNRAGLEGPERLVLAQPHEGGPHANPPGPTWGRATAGVCRGTDGVSRWLDGTPVTFATGESVKYRKERLREMGNSVDVRVAEFIGRRIVALGG